MTGPGRKRGVVVEFDEAAGLGQVDPGDQTGAGVEMAGRPYLFHCTQIADGTRTIAIGTAVTFEVVPGRNGRWEAAQIRPDTTPGG
jgi:CspA family cold shock protein